jgi:hypothetical protein
LLYGSKASDRNCVTMACPLPPAAALSKPGGMGLKLDGDPGALMVLLGTVPGGVTEIAAWMLGVLNVTVNTLLLLLLSRLLSALDVSVSSTAVTCTSAAGLLTEALPAMNDKASTTNTAAAPVELMGADATADSTLRAVLCVCADRVALDASTTASTRAAAVAADELVRVVPADNVVFARPASTLVCAAARAAPVMPDSCEVTDATAAVTFAPTAVRFTGGDGGRVTVAEKEPTTVIWAPLTPEATKSEFKSLAKATGSKEPTLEVSEEA